MKNYLRIIIISIILALLIMGGIFIFYKLKKRSAQPPISLTQIQQKNMKLTSSAFENNGIIPQKYACDGENINPPLKISEVPEGVKSLALIVDDPDAPMGTWVHWLVWNIDPSISTIEENSVPTGTIKGLNDFKKNSYGGPCPPSGTHHYHFKLYALDKMIDLNDSSAKKELEKAMEDHILDWAELVGLYQRK
jgi:hypothetical protein